MKAGLLQQIRRMEVGQHLCIPGYSFREAFRCGYPSIYNTPEEAFLSNMVGSAWGGWRVRVTPETGDYIISRHEESEKRYYVDPDRAHLFKRTPSGILENLR